MKRGRVSSRIDNISSSQEDEIDIEQPVDSPPKEKREKRISPKVAPEPMQNNFLIRQPSLQTPQPDYKPDDELPDVEPPDPDDEPTISNPVDPQDIELQR